MLSITFIGVEITSINNFTYYKTKSTGPISSLNVLKTCSQSRLLTPCYSQNWSDSNCVTTTGASDFSYFSKAICDNNDYRNCDPLNGLFAYMRQGFKNGSAYGIVSSSTVNGEDHSDKWSLCSRRN